jgi:hypothetical protein
MPPANVSANERRSSLQTYRDTGESLMGVTVPVRRKPVVILQIIP